MNGTAGGAALGPNGEILGPVPGSVLDGAGYTPTLRENLALGVGKAHRGVCYANFDYRNRQRSGLGTQGRST